MFINVSHLEVPFLLLTHSNEHWHWLQFKRKTKQKNVNTFKKWVKEIISYETMLNFTPGPWSCLPALLPTSPAVGT